MRPLRIALTKGRLEKKAVEIFEAAGMDCTEMHNAGRKLLIDLQGGMQCVLAKAPDVLTYVEYGVCDIGIVGKDTILEYGKSFYEVLDLGFGKCRFSVAGKAGNDFYSGHTRKKIATKYPVVARNHFLKKGIDVEIIKIEGSVELAPILGLADAIVDLVETGNTLKENGLSVYEDICNISARMIVNVASMKMRHSELDLFITKIKKVQGGVT